MGGPFHSATRYEVVPSEEKFPSANWGKLGREREEASLSSPCRSIGFLFCSSILFFRSRRLLSFLYVLLRNVEWMKVLWCGCYVFFDLPSVSPFSGSGRSDCRLFRWASFPRRRSISSIVLLFSLFRVILP